MEGRMRRFAALVMALAGLALGQVAVPDPPKTPAPTPSPVTLSCTCGWPAAATAWRTLYNTGHKPVYAASYNDGSNEKVTIGLKFKSSRAGEIGAIRYFRAQQEGDNRQRKVKIYDYDSGVVVGNYIAPETRCGDGWSVFRLPTTFKTLPHRPYIVAIEGLSYYVKSDASVLGLGNGPLVALQSGALFSFSFESHPTMWTDANYYVDLEWAETFPAASPICAAPIPPSAICIHARTDRPPATETKAKSQIGLLFNATSVAQIRAVRFFKTQLQHTHYAGDNPRTVRITDVKRGNELIGGATFNDGACAGNDWISIPLPTPIMTQVGGQYRITVEPVSVYGIADPWRSFVKPLSIFSWLIPCGGSYYTGGIWNQIWNPFQPVTYQTTLGRDYYVDVELMPYVAPPPTARPTPAPTIPPTSRPTSTPPPRGEPEVRCGFLPASSRSQCIHSVSDYIDCTDNEDGIPLVLATRFSTTITGDIVSIRFYKSEAEAVTRHTMRLYDETQGTTTSWSFTASSCKSGWITAVLPTPYRTAVGSVYNLAVDPVWHYPKTEGYFDYLPTAVGYINVFGSAYGLDPGIMPTRWDHGYASYFIDLDFVPNSKALPAGGPPPIPAFQCDIWPVLSTGTETYFSMAESPATPSLTDEVPLVLGLVFGTAVEGDVTAFRFYKAPGEGGEGHLGKIYDADTQALLATTGNFTDRTCGGGRWVIAPFDPPFRTTVGTRYVLAIDAVDYYPKDEDWFSDSPEGDARGNLIGYGSRAGTTPGAWPAWDAGKVNYWVDVEFRPTLSSDDSGGDGSSDGGDGSADGGDGSADGGDGSADGGDGSTDGGDGSTDGGDGSTDGGDAPADGSADGDGWVDFVPPEDSSEAPTDEGDAPPAEEGDAAASGRRRLSSEQQKKTNVDKVFQRRKHVK